MKVELLGRFIKSKVKEKLSDEDKAEMAAKKIINPDYEDEDEETKFEYEPITISLNEGIDFLKLDDKHTQLLKHNGQVYIIKMKYEHFRTLFTEVTGLGIQKIAYTN